MKKIISITLFIFCTLTIWSQNHPNKEKIEAFRVEFYTNHLQLSDEESKVFWPIFREIAKEKEVLKKELESYGKLELMNDTQLEKFIIIHFDIEKKQLALKHEFYLKLKDVLPIRKVANLPKVERAFKRKLLQEAQKRRERNSRNR